MKNHINSSDCNHVCHFDLEQKESHNEKTPRTQDLNLKKRVFDNYKG